MCFCHSGKILWKSWIQTVIQIHTKTELFHAQFAFCDTTQKHKMEHCYITAFHFHLSKRFAQYCITQKPSTQPSHMAEHW